MKKRLARAAVTAATVLGLSVPGVVAANSGSIDTTGPDSTNKVSFEHRGEVDIENNNSVNATLNTDQDAESGDVNVKHNTTSDGDAVSGDAMNESMVDATVDIDNSGSWSGMDGCACGGDADHSGDISNTGPDSYNHVEVDTSHEVDIENNNSINFTSNVHQDADSGDVRVEDNTTAGGATSGNVSNTSSSSFSFSISN
jgi:hypothetical protein